MGKTRIPETPLPNKRKRKPSTKLDGFVVSAIPEKKPRVIGGRFSHQYSDSEKIIVHRDINNTPTRALTGKMKQSIKSYGTPDGSTITKRSDNGSPLELKSAGGKAYCRGPSINTDLIKKGRSLLTLFQSKKSAEEPVSMSKVSKNLSRVKYIPEATADTYVAEGVLNRKSAAEAARTRKNTPSVPATDIAYFYSKTEKENLAKNPEKKIKTYNHSHSAPHSVLCAKAKPISTSHKAKSKTQQAADSTDSRETIPAVAAINYTRVPFENALQRAVVAYDEEFDFRDEAKLQTDKKGKPLLIVKTDTMTAKGAKGSCSVTIRDDIGKPPKQYFPFANFFVQQISSDALKPVQPKAKRASRSIK